MTRTPLAALRIAVLAFCAAFLAPAQAAPVQSPLLTGGEVMGFHQVSTTSYLAAARGGGVFKTTDSGVNWAPVGTFGMRYANAIAGIVNTTTAYVATWRGVFKTTNANLASPTWTQLTFDNTISVAVDPANANNVLAGVPGTGIIRSTNGGTSWTIATGLDSTEVTSMVFASSSVVYAGLYGNYLSAVQVPPAPLESAYGGVFKSVDGGATWTSWNAPAGSPLPDKFVTAVEVDTAGNLFAGTDGPLSSGGTVYRSSAATGAWTNVGAGGGLAAVQLLGIRAIYRDRNVANRLWVGSARQGTALTTNSNAGSITWMPGWNYNANQTEAGYLGPLNAIFTPTGVANKVMRAVGGLGIFETAGVSPTAETSTARNSGLTAVRATSMAVDGANWYVGAIQGRFFRSANSGASWSNPTGLEARRGCASPCDFVYVHTGAQVSSVASQTYGATEGSNGGLHKFNGSIWLPLVEAGLDNDPTGITTGHAPVYLRPTGLMVDPANANIVYYSLFDTPVIPGQSPGLLRRDAGGNWTKVVNQPLFGGGGAQRVYKTPNNRYFALFNDSCPFISGDGTTFAAFDCNSGPFGGSQIAHTGFSRLYFTSVAELNATVLVAATNKGIFRSTDFTASWQAVNAIGLNNSVLTALVYAGPLPALFGTDRDGKFYCSNDNGVNWATKATLNHTIVDLKLFGSTLFLVTDGGGVYTETSLTCP